MKKKYNIVALLPMKANSERVKGKNFKDFCGKPLFRWTLDTLISEKRIDKVIINTDARSILKDHNLKDDERVLIRDRKKSICGDHVSMNKIIHDDLLNIDSNLYLMTHTTNPLLTSLSISKSIDLYMKGLDKDYDSLFTVNKIQSRFYDENSNPINHDPDDL